MTSARPLRLHGHVKAYDWGSTSAIQGFAGRGAEGRPVAEVWFGAHPAGPTMLDGGESLHDLLAREPALLGEAVGERYGELPFLMKLIAPGRAVSLQVHPRLPRARAEFTRPTGASVFVDANHKPEMIYALTPFEGLVGLRAAEEAAEILRRSAHPLLRAAADLLDAEGDMAGAIAMLGTADAGAVREAVAASAGGGRHPALRTMTELAEQYPGDAGALVSLLLERRSLAPGEAVFVASGVPHAYLSGLAVEIMANSDNVFRLGLTSKPVDIGESLRNLLDAPAPAVAVAEGAGRWPVEAGAEEFALAVYRGWPERFLVDQRGPAIALVVDGSASFAEVDGTVHRLRRGEALFLPHGARVEATVDGGFVVGSVPTP